MQKFKFLGTSNHLLNKSVVSSLLIDFASLDGFEIDNIEIGLFFYFGALIGFWGSLVFYNSLLLISDYFCFFKILLKIIAPPIKNINRGNNHKKYVFLLNEGSYKIHSPYLL